jgi:hypothetical protein
MYSKRLIHDDIRIESGVWEILLPNSRHCGIATTSGVEEVPVLQFWLNLFQFCYALLMWFALFVNTQSSVYFKLISRWLNLTHY